MLSRRKFLTHFTTAGAVLSTPLLQVNTAFAQDLPGEITPMTASQLSQAIRSRQVSCVEVMRAYIKHIHQYNPVYNAIVSMGDDEQLINQAKAADQALDKGQYWGWMHGMPHAVKDLANAAGLETSLGSRLFAGTIASTDSLHVARMRKQGAIFIGKTNTPEFGMGSQSYNPVHGTTKNAYDPKLTAGGSSGGAAAGLATHMLPCADGSDMMGSLRNPAAFNNVIGFRPSQGRVPSVPSSDFFYNQLGINGPLGRNVEDTIRLLVTMAGYDAHAPLSLRDHLPAYENFKPVKLTDYRIGWMSDYGSYLATEPGLLDLCQKSLESLAVHGVEIDNAQPAYNMERLWQTWLTLRHWSTHRMQPLYDDPKKRALLKPEIIWEIEGGLDMPASRISDAATARSEWYLALEKLFEKYDLLALPSAQVFPFSADIHWPKSINGQTMDTYHRWMEIVIGGTLAGLPVVNLPAGFDHQGRPMGMQFMGRMGEDRKVLEFALTYEAVTQFLEKRPVM